MEKFRSYWKKRSKKKIHRYYSQKPPEFKEKSIIIIRNNPEKATVEYWCDNKQVNFISEIHNNRPYSFKFYVEFSNCSIRFLNFVHEKKNQKI
jgi:hypothetical protein